MTTLPLDPYISTSGYFHNPTTPGDNAYHEPPVMRSFAAAIRSEIGSSVPLPPDLSNYFTKSESDARFEQFTNKAVASGYAPLDAAGLIPTVHIPPLAINDTFVVASEAAMLALTAQRGDMAIRTDTGRTYVLSAEPASTLANWKEVLAAGQVTSVNGKTGVVNLTATDVGAYTKAESDAKYALIGASYTKAESDAKYALIGHNHDAAYVAVARTITAGAGLTGGGDLTVDRTFNVGAGTGITVAADSVALDTTYADARYALIGHNHNGVYLPVGTHIPPDTHITSANGSVTIVESPTGTFDLAATGGGSGNGPFLDPIIREKIQWGASPAGAVDTWLWRVGAGVLRVQRPGAAGGAADGVEVSLSSRSGPGGTTGAASLDWQVDGNIRWLMQMTPDNGPLITYDYGSDGLTFQERFRISHGGAVRFTGTVAGGATPAFPGWIAVTNPTSTSHAWFGQAVPGTSSAARADFTANIYYSGTAWTLQDAASPATIMSFLPQAGNLQSCLVGMWDVPAGASAVLAERFNLTRGGNLGLGDTNPIGGIPVHSGNRIIKLGGTGVLEANGSRTFVAISDNYYFSASNVGFTITNNVSSYLQQADGVLTFANALTTAPGVGVSQRARMTIDMNGTASFFSDGAQVSVDARNQIRVRPGGSGLAGIWFMSGDNVDRAFLGMDASSTTSWRFYAPAIGNVITCTLNDGYVSFARGVGISGALTVTGTVTGNGSVFNLASTANIQFSPAGTIVHPSGNNTIHLGWVGLNWANCYAANFVGDGQITVRGGTHTIISSGADPWCVYVRPGGHTWFDGNSTGQVSPEIDNKMVCGGVDGHRWKYVSAAQGSINTCWAHEKEIVSIIDPDDALDAVLNSPMFLFHPKDFEGTIDEKLTFAGPVSTSVDSRLRIGEGALTAAGHQAAFALASVQSLNAKLAAALERIVQLEEKLNGR